MTQTHTHDAIHVINQAGMGQGWAQSLINEAFYAVFEDYDQAPDFNEISSQDQDLIDTLNQGWEIIASQQQ